MMSADVTFAPFAGGYITDVPFEVREIQQPIVAFTLDSGGVVPVVVAFGIGSEMDVADRRFTGGNFLVADEALPQVGVSRQPFESLEQHGLSPVSERFQHLAHTALVGEAHDDEATSGRVGVLQRWCITPESPRARHDRLVKPGMREAKNPDFINLSIGHTVKDIELVDDRVVIHFLWLIRR